MTGRRQRPDCGPRPPALPAGLVVFFYCPAHHLEFPLVLLGGEGVGHMLVAAGLAQQLAVALPALARDGPLRQRLGHRAALLAGVRTVAVAAASSDLHDLFEGAADAFLPGPE